MHNTTLPTHASGLIAIGVTKRGRPIYPIQGGAPEDGAGGSGSGDGADKGGDGGDGGGNDSGTKEFTPITSQADLERILGQRLTREKAQYSKFDEYKTAAEELARIKDGEKSEAQKATERADNAERELATLRFKELQREVAAAKGVPLKSAHRLQGSTKEELEADADDFLSDYTPQSGSAGGKRIPGKPKENLRGGGNPDDAPEETDPRKLAALVPRN